MAHSALKLLYKQCSRPACGYDLIYIPIKLLMSSNPIIIILYFIVLSMNSQNTMRFAMHSHVAQQDSQVSIDYGQDEQTSLNLRREFENEEITVFELTWLCGW